MLSDLYIRTKKQQLIKLNPNAPQRKFLDKHFPDWRTKPVSLRGKRAIILKARQQGFSTIVEALIFCDTINHGNTYSLVLGAKRESSIAIFRMVHLFYRMLPPEKRRPTKYASKYELYWEDINSSMYVGSAEVGDTGRGSTINNLHCTEIPSWPNPETLMTSVLEAVPDEDGFVVLESTAEGVGNYYHTTWNEAAKGENNYAPMFSAWFEDPTNRSPVPEGFEPFDHDHEKYGNEVELINLYGVDHEQLTWRRRKINDQKGKFAQEHPSSPEEAFLVSGNPYFERKVLNQRLRFLDANPSPTFAERPESARIRSVKPNELTIYSLPIEGRVYCMGADPSEGLNQKGTDHDYSVAGVFDAETWEEAALLHGRWSPREFGLMLADLGFWFNTALIGVERNNHGHAVLNALIYEGGYPEQRGTNGTGCYMHQEFDVNRIPTERRPGYPTTTKTKALSDDDLASAIAANEILFHSPITIEELMRYVKLPGGKAGGDGGSHDDIVRQVAIALQMLRLRPRGVKVPAMEVW